VKAGLGATHSPFSLAASIASTTNDTSFCLLHLWMAMSIFDRPVSDITAQDVSELLKDYAVENMRLEFKREVPGKDETLKKLSSFANTFGGFLVVGADANSADGRLKDLPGVDLQAGFKQTIVQWCFGYVSPPLNVEVSDPIPTPDATGKVCYVLFVHESDLAPHFLNGRKGVYIRTDEFSARFEARLANENELRHLMDRRALIRGRRTALIERARSRFQAFTEHRYREFKKGNSKPKESIGARFNLTILPRFPGTSVCEHTALFDLLRSERIPWRGTGFPKSYEGPVCQHESVINFGAGTNFSILEGNVWGMLFFATEIEEQTSSFAGIHLNQFLGNILAFLRYAAYLLTKLHYTGPLRVEMQMEGMRGVRWVWFDHDFPENGPASELDDTITFSLDTSSDALISRPDAIVVDILRYVFFATNWPHFAGSSELLLKLINAGYEYNNWPKVSSSA
jgi:hypothetical protein